MTNQEKHFYELSKIYEQKRQREKEFLDMQYKERDIFFEKTDAYFKMLIDESQLKYKIK